MYFHEPKYYGASNIMANKTGQNNSYNVKLSKVTYINIECSSS